MFDPDYCVLCSVGQPLFGVWRPAREWHVGVLNSAMGTHSTWTGCRCLPTGTLSATVGSLPGPPPVSASGTSDSPVKQSSEQHSLSRHIARAACSTHAAKMPSWRARTCWCAANALLQLVLITSYSSLALTTQKLCLFVDNWSLNIRRVAHSAVLPIPSVSSCQAQIWARAWARGTARVASAARYPAHRMVQYRHAGCMPVSTQAGKRSDRTRCLGVREEREDLCSVRSRCVLMPRNTYAMNKCQAGVLTRSVGMPRA